MSARRLLREAAPPDPAARDRAWRVVERAWVDLPARAPRRRWRVAVATAGVACVAALGATAVAAPNSDVGHFVRSVLGIADHHPQPALVHVPGGGQLLVHAGDSMWVAADASRRRLGAYDDATWSPHGMFVAAWRGGTLTALTPAGTPRWSITRPHAVAGARWAPGDGYRIAYLEGTTLRVINGDGTGDHAYAAARAGIAPAWQPGAKHVLAYITSVGRVAVVKVDERRAVWRGRPLLDAPFELRWSADGRRLVVVTAQRVLVYDRDGRVVRRIAAPGVTAAAWAPRGHRLAVVAPVVGGSTRLVVYEGDAARTLFTAPGTLGVPAWAPDGMRILVPWPQAGQWLFLRVSGPLPAVQAVAGVARQFTPGAKRPPFPGAVSWCC